MQEVSHSETTAGGKDSDSDVFIPGITLAAASTDVADVEQPEPEATEDHSDINTVEKSADSSAVNSDGDKQLQEHSSSEIEQLGVPVECDSSTDSGGTARDLTGSPSGDIIMWFHY